MSPTDNTRPEPKKPVSRRDFMQFAAAAGAAAGLTGSAAFAQKGGGKKTKMDTPVITCVEDGSTQVSINIKVCAPGGSGATDMPAGFSLQWIPASLFDTPVADGGLGGVWPASDDPRLCKASFSGNANESRYNLVAGECVTVNIGELLDDNGASTNCSDLLDCGTEYVFRAFAHASSALQRSDFTANRRCSTLDCEKGDTCTLTQGYWKTHGLGTCQKGNNLDMWPVKSLMLGEVAYTQDELCNILHEKPKKGNGLVSLAKQLIAAKLNVANGADPTAVATAIAAADVLIDELVVPPVGADSLTTAATTALREALTAYNEGKTGPGHCGTVPVEDDPA